MLFHGSNADDLYQTQDACFIHAPLGLFKLFCGYLLFQVEILPATFMSVFKRSSKNVAELVS